MTEDQMFDWVLRGQRDTRYVESYIHDGLYELWIDESGRLDYPDELWLMKHAPRFKGDDRYALLAGRCVVMAAGFGEYPDHGPEFASAEMTPDRAVGYVCRWIPPRMQAQAKRISKDSMEPLVAFNDDSMSKLEEKIKEQDGWLSMLAVSCEPAYVMTEKQDTFLRAMAITYHSMGALP